MRIPSKFRYFLATEWQHFCNIRWLKYYFYNIKTLLMNCFQNWKEQSVRFFFLHFFIDFLFSEPWWVRRRVPETEPLPESRRCPVPDSYIASYRILLGCSLWIPVLQPFAAMHVKVRTDVDILCADQSGAVIFLCPFGLVNRSVTWLKLIKMIRLKLLSESDWKTKKKVV